MVAESEERQEVFCRALRDVAGCGRALSDDYVGPIALQCDNGFRLRPSFLCHSKPAEARGKEGGSPLPKAVKV